MSPYAVPELAELTRSGEAKRLRVAAGISRVTMAAGLGITRNYLARLERGAAMPGHLLGPRYLRVLRGLVRHEEAWKPPRRVAVLVAAGGQVRAEVASGFGGEAGAGTLKRAVRTGRQQRAADDELLRDLGAALHEPERAEASVHAGREAWRCRQQQGEGQ